MAKIKVEGLVSRKNKEMKFFPIKNKTTAFSMKLKNIFKRNTDQLKIHPSAGIKTNRDHTQILVVKNYSVVLFFSRRKNLYHFILGKL